ncbi:hypothetical protein COCVIDRAFT_105083, partial [Bipolaris victoriae FI3]
FFNPPNRYSCSRYYVQAFLTLYCVSCQGACAGTTDGGSSSAKPRLLQRIPYYIHHHHYLFVSD